MDHVGEINRHLRDWARGQRVADVVSRGQALGVPVAKYNTPADVLADPHEQARGLFSSVEVGGAGELEMLVAPFKLTATPPTVESGPPALGAHEAAVLERLGAMRAARAAHA